MGAGEIGTAGVAIKTAGAPSFLFQNGAIVVGFREWITSGGGLRAQPRWRILEAALLGIARAEIVVIVRPGLADRPTLGWRVPGSAVLVKILEAVCGWVPTRSNDVRESPRSRRDRRASSPLVQRSRDATHAGMYWRA
jgi:hypothetical protein